ncbi:MAG: tRNA threonylcarbamoyladenosine dehydratase [Clostridia bacterium]|nr:tRNA threonylcarbamoyladenosine dehydratase [Clostridia bacterium]
MLTDFSRTQNLLGKEAIDILNKTSVTIFGLGGVGSYTAEALARCSVGRFILIDSDVVAPSNINRQIIALNSTVGKYKTDIMKERILDINKDAVVDTYNMFYLPNNDNTDVLFRSDYIIDAIDTISAKIDIVKKANKKNIPIISAMGAGNKLNPLLFEVSDIYKTSVCPLCRVMRKELKKQAVPELKVVYSKEKPVLEHNLSSEHTPASISFVPSVMGLIIASEVIKDILKIK